MPTIAFFAAHDSEFKLATRVGEKFESNHWNVSYCSPKGLMKISNLQLEACGLERERIIRHRDAELIEVLFTFDVVVFVTPGPHTERIIYKLRDYFCNTRADRRPIIVTCFVGINIKALYSSFLQRSASDIICVNSKSDMNLYTKICSKLKINPNCLRMTGLGIIARNTARTIQDRSNKKILFADQVAIPQKAKERIILYKRLCDLAEALPEVRLVIKPRHRPGEKTGHRMVYSPERFFERFTPPSNLVVDYAPIQEQIQDSDLLITVSSTAAFEALATGIDVAIVGDLGIGEIYGNHIFLESGLIRTIDQIAAYDIGKPNDEWLDLHSSHLDPVKSIYFEVEKELSHKQMTKDYRITQSPYFDSRSIYYRYVQEMIEKKDNPLVLKKIRQERGLVYKIGEQCLPPIVANPLYKMLCRLGIM